jgi:hypothetical protein
MFVLFQLPVQRKENVFLHLSYPVSEARDKDPGISPNVMEGPRLSDV